MSVRAAHIHAAMAWAHPRELLYVPILVSMDSPDCAWSEAICMRLAAHADEQVRANAILGFGHLARTCGRLDERAVKPIIVAALRDPSAIVQGQAMSAANDVEHFLGWRIVRPT